MYQGRGIRTGRSLRRRHENEEDNIVFALERGVSGVVREVLGVVCRQDGIPKGRRLSYLNAAVRSISKITSSNQSKKSSYSGEEKKMFDDMVSSNEKSTSPQPQVDFGEEVITKEQYFCLLRCCLVHEGKEVRAGGLRLLRYLIQTPEDVQALITVNTVPLIIRCMDIMLDNQIERVQSLRLARRMLQVAPSLFPVSLARCLIAIARDGAKERDRLLRSALATLNEMAVLNTAVFVECGGVGVLLHNILDCAMPRINEALLGAILYLLNTPEWRPHCAQLHQILAPFSDFHYKHTSYDLEYYSKSEERDLRTQAGKLAVLVCLRSWSGLVSLCQPDTAALRSLIALLYPNHEDTRKTIIELLYELFRVPFVNWVGDYEEALAQHGSVSSSDTDTWRLHESFVAAEARAVLPHIAKYRANLIQNHLALVLYTLICVDLFPALCEVIVTSSAPVSVKTTILLGELLHQANQNLPGECGSLSHSLPILLERAAGNDPNQRMRATQAITALLMLARSQLNSHGQPMSLYLAHIIRCSPKAKERIPKVYNASSSAKLSKWLGKDHDELIQQTLKESDVLISGRDPHTWKWDLIIPVLRWPSLSLQRLDDSSYRLFIKRVLHFYKPSAGLFANVELTHNLSQVFAQGLLHFCDFLLGAAEDDCSKYFEELLVDVSMNLSYVVCERPPHDAVLSPSRLNTTTAQYYFLALGRLSHSQRGYDMLLKAGIFEQLQELVSVSNSDMYAKLVSTCLDYSINGLNRAILTKILTGCQESARVYATQFLRALVRVGADDFARWGVELLVAQLYDESRIVSLAALDVLEEACDNEEYLEAILCAPPSVLHLGDRGQLLMAKLVSSPRGFRAYRDANFINTLLQKWSTTYNYKYVKLMQTAVNDSVTQHQRGEDGAYGRRTGSKHVVHDVFLLPHLYGSLTQHKEGFSILMQHDAVRNMVQIIKAGAVSNPREIFQLKVAIWAMGHVGLSSDGAGFLSCEGVLPVLTHLAATCPVYSVRGTCFHALCLVATTKDGSNLLRKYGWECVQRHHHERWQFVEETLDVWSAAANQGQDENYINIGGHQISESDMDDFELSKPGFYVGDDSEDGSDGGSLLVEGIGLDDSYPTSGKSQTLPHKSKPPTTMGHQRSLSDCAPVMEELTSSDPPQMLPSQDDLTLGKRSSLRLSKLLASVRRKSERRRESTSSRASNSSTASDRMTDRMAAFLQSARRIRGISSRSHSLTDPMGSDDEAGDQRYTLSSDSLSDPAQDMEFSAAELPHDGLDISRDSSQAENSNFLTVKPQLECRLSPIASGASIATLGSQSIADGGVELRRGGRGGSIRGSSGALFAEDTIDRAAGSSTPILLGSAAITGQPLSTQSYLTLRSITNHRRVVSESSQEEKTTRNSLKGFLSSSYEHSGTYLMRNLLDVRGMVRSPSGCSEVSSVRSAGVRGSGPGGSSSRGLGSQALSSMTHHQSGQCFLGFALPLDLDLLLYDDLYNKNIQQQEGGDRANAISTSNGISGKDRFPAITESELETQSEENISRIKTNGVSNGRRKISVDKAPGLESEGTGLELHTPQTCLACFSIAPPSTHSSPLHKCESNGQVTESLVVESPPLQRVKAMSEVSEASESSSVNSQGWDDLGEGKSGPERVNQTLLRKEILRFITNLLSSIAARSSESGLLTLKQRWPHAFRDSCLYSEICLILSSYNYRLTARRFIQELFMDQTFAEIYTEANRLLNNQLEGLCETVNPVVHQTPASVHAFTLQAPTMADIAEVTLSDKSDKEEDC
ncbi:rapamycin-insensitive companion of mTOR-like [Homarus americanus]|uniref:Rapamycin-insensitive companion of mTOR-like n=1 Tax=Homarus americanus TaxID=6706 RepID=A0A8J5JP53_HOMAM|nr:rapamycin-insensitive companion of mTOR-like [Homarus americanus]KAG7156669.1 Rapamycin-insensitive companion of mTOR-like [Homarus americanus]